MKPTSISKTSVYYPELDGLRFLAFLLVLIHHSPSAASVPLWKVVNDYGWVGVDLFLCLSAYLFAKLLFVEYREKGTIHIRYFYLRRLLRIWPLYFFFFGGMLVYSIFLKGWSFELFIRSLGMVTFTDNLFSMAYGYNQAIAYSGHLWTISYEEQFYLVIPWALLFLYQQKHRTILYIFSIAALLGMLIRAAFIYFDAPHPAIWVFPLTHFESIFGGLIVGLGLLDRFSKYLSSWLLLTGGLLALWLVTRLPNIEAIQWKLMLTYPLVGIGTSLLLLATVKGGLGPVSVLLHHKAIGYLGKISYGLYVYHLVAIDMATDIVNAYIPPDRLLVYPAAVVITALILTISISALSYQFLEKTFLRLKGRFAFISSRPI